MISYILPIILIGVLEFLLFSMIYSLPVWCVFTYAIITVFVYAGAVVAFAGHGFRAIDRSEQTNFLIGLGFTSLAQKIVLMILFSIAAILSLVLIDSWSWWIKLIFYCISLIVVLALIYGLIYGKYKYQLETEEISLKGLPAALDGLRIVQISDAHAGTWDKIEGVEKGINLIKEQEPDLILFTGDLVNSNKDEIDPFIELFAELTATHGKYAVLGNHDYYGQPREKELRPVYYHSLYGKFEQMGFDLLLNDSRILNIHDQELAIVGVENWGEGRFFPKRGDLQEAFTKVPENMWAILMSHDPSHWDKRVLPFERDVPLTLSGHTHAMQFGINLPFFKWSPVKYRYKRWMGLYKKDGQQLYVNRGFGLLAFPGRVGMSAEVSLLTLRSV